MTDTEFSDWIVSHMRVFPDMKAWLTKMEEADRRALQEAWRDALRDVELQDAKEVTRQMVSGDIPPIAAFERESTAATVRKFSKELASARRSFHREREYEPRQSCENPIAGNWFREIMRRLKNDSTLTARQVAAEVIPPIDPTKGPRFNCPLCFDTGLVTVWSERSIRAAIENRLDDANNRRSCAAPCSCKRGERFIWRGTNAPKEWSGWRSSDAVYSEDRHFLCPGGDTEDAAKQAAFKEWCAVRLLEAQEGKRHSVFDRYNAGATA